MRISNLGVDCCDPTGLATFWQAVLGGELRAEVERVMALGATPVDIGQGEQSWVVLADPEGNEFCILSSR